MNFSRKIISGVPEFAVITLPEFVVDGKKLLEIERRSLQSRCLCREDTLLVRAHKSQYGR